MAGFNPLAARRYHELVRRVLGEELSLESVSPEITLARILDFDPPEEAIYKKLRFWSTGLAQVAAGTANSTCQIINPANSNLLVVVLAAKILQKATAGAIQATIDGALIVPGQAPNVGLDTRLTNVAATIPVQSRNTILNSTGINGIQVDAASSTVVNSDILLPSILTYDRWPLAILAPNHRFNVWNQTAAEAAKFFVFGYERDARPEELEGTS